MGGCRRVYVQVAQMWCDDGSQARETSWRSSPSSCIYNEKKETHEPQDKSTNEIRFGRDCHMIHQTRSTKTREIKQEQTCVSLYNTTTHPQLYIVCFLFPPLHHLPKCLPNLRLPPAKRQPPRPQLKQQQRLKRREKQDQDSIRRRGERFERRRTLLTSTRVCCFRGSCNCQLTG